MDEAVRNALLKQYLEDSVQGVERTLQNYQALFPNNDELVRREIEAIRAEEGPEPEAGAAESRLEHIGPYRVIDQLGSGGMGDVYLAEQRGAVIRRVALKVIKLGMDTKEVIARFEAERQALALMEHPNIATVLEAGATEEGRPYFAMEYVRGLPITEHCDQEQLGVDERLQLFLQVCEAVQHAHQRGVIHRDLKPSNVLVAAGDGKALPKVIDFGIAKAMSRRLTERTLHTSFGSLIGTPEYMSPEQAGANPFDVDTRADIYSLGVLLYELLTGTLPFQRDSRDDCESLLRRVRSQDAPPPSTRIDAGVAERRTTSSSALQRRLRGDLDWITLKTLEKDRDRRYETAAQFAADIRRHLAHEPVEAGPPSALYRMKKLVRRYRVPIGSAATIMVGLAAALVVALRALDAESIARARESSALREKSDALADYRRMRDVPLVEDLIREADDELWPARPEMVAAMDAWLVRARQLAERGPLHERRLRELRARAIPPTPEVGQRVERLAALREERASKADRLTRAKNARSRRARLAGQDLEVELQALDVRIADEEAAIDAQRWHFASYEDRFQHVNLASVTSKIRTLTGVDGLIEQVAARRERATTVGRRSLADVREAWQRARRRVAANDLYRGTPALEPELGLVPLGPDPASSLEELAVLDTGEVPTRDEAGRLVFDGASAIVLVLIPAGRFYMGAQAQDPDSRNYDPQAQPVVEFPVHEVTLDAFLIAKHEMTQGQWLRVMGTNPSAYGPGRQPGGDVTLQHPVENVTWFECSKAMARLALALPTGAQWEYAARAGTTTPWWTGRDKLSLQGGANLADMYCRDHDGHPDWNYELDLIDGYTVHAPCGTLRANAFGLHNVGGNVKEWCRDRYSGYEVKARPGDGARDTPGEERRTYRGGAWNSVASLARSAYRYAYRPEDRRAYVGLRPARPLVASAR